MATDQKRALGVIALFLLGLAITYQNCGGKTGGLVIGGQNNSTLCNYGINQLTGACNPPPSLNAPPTYSCQIAPVGSSTPDPTRCTNVSNCILACGETMVCKAQSNIAPPTDTLVGCQVASQGGACNAGLTTDPLLHWVKSSTSPGSYLVSFVNNTSLYSGATDVINLSRVRDTLSQYSPDFTYTIKACNGTGGTVFGPQSFTVSCSAGNNQTSTVSQAITLPAGVSAADLRILSAVVAAGWTNNGFSTSTTYTNPPLLKGYFSSNILKLDCTQISATVTFSVGTSAGLTVWQVTNRSQLP